MDWEEKEKGFEEDLQCQNSTKRMDAVIELVQIYLWRQAIEDELRQLLRMAGMNIIESNMFEIKARFRYEHYCLLNGAGERYFIDGQLVLTANHQEIEGKWVFNIISPITEGELNV